MKNKKLFKDGDHIADKKKAKRGILGAGTISSGCSEGYWVTGVSGGSTRISIDDAISVEEAMDILNNRS